MKVIANANGNVPFIMKAGSDYVRGEMSLESAQYIVDKGCCRSTKFPGFEVEASSFYFHAEANKKQKKQEKTDV